LSQASNLSIAFRRAPRIGDLDPTVFCAPFVAAVIGDRFGPAVAFGRKPVGGDAVLREPRRHRLRPRFRKRLVIGVVADEAWASLKSFQRKEQEKQENGDERKDRGNANVNFRGEKRSNQTHESKTDPDAKRARKGDGKEAKLSYSGNLLVENRNGLIVDATVLEATGTAERDAALAMMEKVPGQQRVTATGDKGHDTRDFVAECRNLQVSGRFSNDRGSGDRKYELAFLRRSVILTVHDTIQPGKRLVHDEINRDVTFLSSSASHSNRAR